MFSTTHIVYIIVSLVLTAGLLTTAFYLIKNEKAKRWMLISFAILTFVLHISIMWVDLFTYNSAQAPKYVLFPMYFCNVCMYGLMIVAFLKKESIAFKWLATFIAWGGVFGGLITIIGSDYLANGFSGWENIKSMLSHSTLLLGCLWLFVGGFVKVRLRNILPWMAGMVFCTILTFSLNAIPIAGQTRALDGMYIWKPILDDTFLYGYVLMPALTGILLVVSIIFELIFVPKVERFYADFGIKDYFRKDPIVLEQEQTAAYEQSKQERGLE
jgi:hypothetical protein